MVLVVPENKSSFSLFPPPGLPWRASAWYNPAVSKKTGKTRSAKLFHTLEQLSRAPDDAPEAPSAAAEDEILDLTSVETRPVRVVADTSKTLRMKKFRAQLLHQWLVSTFAPCRAADIGGGKGLISYLLIESGWQAAVIDPFDQALPDKYKDIRTERRVKIPPEAAVPRIVSGFEVEQAADFDLLIGMHAHGCNARIIDAAARYGCGFVIFPCCVIDEPFFPRLGVHWLESLASYALYRGLEFFPFRLNFKGQNIGLCSPGSRCRLKQG